MKQAIPGGLDSHLELDDVGVRLLVRAFYRCLLGREPDPQGFEHNVERLHGLGGFRGVEQMLSSFMAGSEFTRRQKERYGALSLATEDLHSGDASVEISSIVSLGTHCYTSAMLKRNGLKRFSGPFDWVFSSTAMVRHCLEDDFRTFLDRGHYEPVAGEQRKEPSHGRCEHRFYRENFGVRSLFNHHDAATDEHHGYFARCVERFRSCAAGNGRPLFVQCLRERSDAVREFEATVQVLDRVTRGGVLNVFVVAQEPHGGVMPELTLAHEVGHHRLYRLGPVSHWRSLAFDDAMDEVAIVRALRRYPLRLAPAEARRGTTLR